MCAKMSHCRVSCTPWTCVHFNSPDDRSKEFGRVERPDGVATIDS
ncbi:hypothetical protein AYI69_g8458, partial [Smittium culicis]